MRERGARAARGPERAWQPAPFRRRPAQSEFVTAESGGGSVLIARADKVGNWEMFKLFTHPQNGDSRVFQALGGHAWRADGDGGGLVDCRGVTPLGWEEFQVV